MIVNLLVVIFSEELVKICKNKKLNVVYGDILNIHSKIIISHIQYVLL